MAPFAPALPGQQTYAAPRYFQHHRCPCRLLPMRSISSRLVIATACLLGIILVAWMIATRRAREVRWIDQSPAARRPRLTVLGKWRVPVHQTWMRIRNLVVGPPVTVSVSGDVCEFESASPL